MAQGAAQAQGQRAIPDGVEVARSMSVSTTSGRPVVVEMFLSQSCKASPASSDYFYELAARRDVVALSWHVDYWNQLAARRVGAWSDPFARADFSARQKIYNIRIRGRDRVFTPQAVIDGSISVVGSNRALIEQRMSDAQAMDEHARATPPALEVAPVAESSDRRIMRVRIDRVGAPYDVYAVAFRRRAVTNVEGGDNAGVTFREANVVTGVNRIAGGQEIGGEFTFEAPSGGHDCAVLVQERNQGRIVAAQYCDGAGSPN